MIDHSGRSFQEAEKIGENAIAFKCDVADEAQVKKTVNDILEEFKTIDILVNNAAVIVRKKIVDMRQEAV